MASAPSTGALATGPNVRPGEKPPTESIEAGAHDEAGALEFAYYFFRALDWSIATNDAGLLRPIVAKTCAPCTAVVSNLDDLRSTGHRIAGGRISVTGARVVTGHFTVVSDVVIQVRTDEQPQELVDRAGRVIRKSPPVTNGVSLVFITWTDGHWKVIDLGGES